MTCALNRWEDDGGEGRVCLKAHGLRTPTLIAEGVDSTDTAKIHLFNIGKE